MGNVTSSYIKNKRFQTHDLDKLSESELEDLVVKMIRWKSERDDLHKVLTYVEKKHGTIDLTYIGWERPFEYAFTTLLMMARLDRNLLKYLLDTFKFDVNKRVYVNDGSVLLELVLDGESGDWSDDLLPTLDLLIENGVDLNAVYKYKEDDLCSKYHGRVLVADDIECEFRYRYTALDVVIWWKEHGEIRNPTDTDKLIDYLRKHGALTIVELFKNKYMISDRPTNGLLDC